MAAETPEKLYENVLEVIGIKISEAELLESNFSKVSRNEDWLEIEYKDETCVSLGCNFGENSKIEKVVIARDTRDTHKRLLVDQQYPNFVYILGVRKLVQYDYVHQGINNKYEIHIDELLKDIILSKD